MGTRFQGPENPVSVAASFALPLQFHMPVITGAMTSLVEFDKVIGGPGAAVRKKQQLQPVCGRSGY